MHPRQNALCYGALNVGKEAGITAQPAHGKAREEQCEEQPPPPGIPPGSVEALALGAWSRLEQRQHCTPSMHEWQHAPAKQREIPLEFPQAADTLRDVMGVAVPESAGVGGELLPTALIQREPALTRARAEQFQELAMIEDTIGRHP